MGWPGDLLGAAGLWCEDCCWPFPRSCPCSCRRAVRGQAGAPAAV